jgi:hypothetical protein
MNQLFLPRLPVARGNIRRLYEYLLRVTYS